VAIMLAQNGMIRVACLVGGARGMTVAEYCYWLVSGYYSDAHGCSNQTIQVYIGLSSFSSSFGLRLYGDGKSMLPGV
jgi:hypothetical protein